MEGRVGMDRGKALLVVSSFFAVLTLFAVVSAVTRGDGKLILEVSEERSRQGGRRLLQSSSSSSTPTCTTSCPSAGQATSACSALSSSTQSTIRNNLIANCGMNTFGSSCCSSIPSDQWSNYLNCMCAGDSVLAGLTAFVNPTQVITACGCKTVSTGSSVTFSGGNSSNSSSDTPGSSAPSPQSGDASNPVATQIIASQTSTQG